LTNEREVDDEVIITECHDVTEVTAQSDVDAGLDNVDVEVVDERASLPVSEQATTVIRDVADTIRGTRGSNGGDDGWSGGGASVAADCAVCLRFHACGEGRGERKMGCGTHFLNRAAFQRGKLAENKRKNRDSRRGTTRKKTFKLSHLGLH